MTPAPEPVEVPQIKRINVALSQRMLSAIELVIAREGVSLTEAVRRLVGYGEFVYRAVKEEGGEVLVRDDDGTLREVVLL